jgi:hypothetical protein
LFMFSRNFLIPKITKLLFRVFSIKDFERILFFLEFLKLLKSHPRSSLITCHCLMFIIKHTFSFSKTWTTKLFVALCTWRDIPRGLSLGERTSSYFKMFLHSDKKTVVYMPGGSCTCGFSQGWIWQHLGAHTLRLALLPQEDLTLPSLPFSNKFALQIVETFVSMNLVWMPKI